MQTVNHYFGHIGIFGMHLLGFLVQRAVIKTIQHLNLKDEVNQLSPGDNPVHRGQTLAASKVIM